MLTAAMDGLRSPLSYFKVVLQKLVEDRKLFGKRIDYAATPKIWLMNLTRF